MTQSFPIVRTVLDTGVVTRADVTLTNPDPIVEHALTCVLDFGDSDADMASTTVYGQNWVLSTSKLGVIDIRRSSSDDAEDALLDEVRATVANIVEGVSFDVIAYAPEGTSGEYIATIRGV